MATQEEIRRIAKIVDDTLINDTLRLGLARRIADVLSSTRDFDRDAFIKQATATKRDTYRGNV